MRPLVALLVLIAWCCAAGPVAAADDDWPCFFGQEGHRFAAALARDVETSRQRMLQKLLGDLDTLAASCPAVTGVLADFRRDLTSAFDEALSKERVLDRLRPRWTRSWNAAQCAEVAALVKPAKVDASTASLTPGEFVAQWMKSPEAAPALGDKKIAQRIADTLRDVKNELDKVQHEANAALAQALPPIIRRDKAAAIAAVDTCIAAEKARLAKEPPPH
jgi:hypothetical protein